MSTLTEMREALEQLEQDGARFRWIAEHPHSAKTLIGDVLSQPIECRSRIIRELIDAHRTLPETPELTKAQMEYGCRAAIDAFLKADPADVIDTHSRLGPFKHG